MNSADIGDLKSVDSLREFVIRGRNIEKLKKRAESFIDNVAKSGMTCNSMVPTAITILSMWRIILQQKY